MQVEVCVGSACHAKGSYNIINRLQELADEYKVADKVSVSAAFCFGHCAHAVSVKLEGEEEIFSVSPATATDFFREEIMPRLPL